MKKSLETGRQGPSLSGWEGNRGPLAQANGGCWKDEYHARISHRWSNLGERLRLARAHTGRKDVYCVDGASHGNSAATLAMGQALRNHALLP